ncbi:MAG: bifunctional proline dehydrogenase/L-glutamate gamma-semialdehyde dehydrogenase PutA [Gammaproteobacteria bacterium]|nr:bifunctional proline dehydrogenase/L-glutamate gamma-semialdehyde dehydrogenase PutA [Gammaproteobacteria bacterium]
MTLLTLPPRDNYRQAIQQAYRCDENQAINNLLEQLQLTNEIEKVIQQRSTHLTEAVRRYQHGSNTLDAFMGHYSLSSEEGIAIMCLAEALLRIPDKQTMDDLIADKLAGADWAHHLGQSDSLFVNASTWALMLTGKCLAPSQQDNNLLTKSFKGFLNRSSAPIVRTAVMWAMKIMGEQFVMAETIEAGIKRAQQQQQRGYSHSYDMLGEAARTAADAERYFNDYMNAINAIGKAANQSSVMDNPGISVKLSALHPCYHFAKRERILAELTPRLLILTQQAKLLNIGLTVDAEEAEMLSLSLDIIEAVFCHPSLNDWNGFGLALQAYQKRAWVTLDWLIALARKNQKRIMVRLVKGAYWDSEIKSSQVMATADYPVFTRKSGTDISFLACAKKMLVAQDALYCQFATHNACSVAAIMEFNADHSDYEFQCLHGMGEPLYNPLLAENRSIRCRIYAPVGRYRDLLPYLVRRLLENGANTSFVNRIKDKQTAISELVRSPIELMKKMASKRHPKIPLPQDIYPNRKNSRGIDLSDEIALTALNKDINKALQQPWQAQPIIATKNRSTQAATTQQPCLSPIDGKIIGSVIESSNEQIEQAFVNSHAAFPAWDQTAIEQRCQCLEKMATLLEENMAQFIALAAREAGKTVVDGIAEVREAVDFCRYYAQQASQYFTVNALVGPTGEYNALSLHGRGVIVCISPWNFPLAIFIGQVSAALAAGNSVIAKPAEQTPLIAYRAVELLHQAGIPPAVVQLLPGRGETVGAKLVSDSRTKGVIFTGSTETARHINQSLAARRGEIVPLIAETGGQNTMIVDSSALLEQVVVDVVTSAFHSAGQRCSALRVLFIQEEIADNFITMLKGAMAELQVGDPLQLASDLGPVIDNDALSQLQNHFDQLNHDADATLIYQVKLQPLCQSGHYFAPCAFEIKQLSQLQREFFGPFLHVIRYHATDISNVLQQIQQTGYGLTQGIHSRIKSNIAQMRPHLAIGNLYINRNMTGAVVGVQPFGGQGLSGTGPKAGGPHYLPRLAVERTITINIMAEGGNASLLMLDDEI